METVVRDNGSSVPSKSIDYRVGRQGGTVTGYRTSRTLHPSAHAWSPARTKDPVINKEQ